MHTWSSIHIRTWPCSGTPLSPLRRPMRPQQLIMGNGYLPAVEIRLPEPGCVVLVQADVACSDGCLKRRVTRRRPFE